MWAYMLNGYKERRNGFRRWKQAYKNSTQGKKATGERYLPKKAREALSDKEYARSTAKKELQYEKESSIVDSLMM